MTIPRPFASVHSRHCLSIHISGKLKVSVHKPHGFGRLFHALIAPVGLIQSIVYCSSPLYPEDLLLEGAGCWSVQQSRRFRGQWAGCLSGALETLVLGWQE